MRTWAPRRSRQRLRRRLRPITGELVIEQRFRGPPFSGQGGYSAGLVAERIQADCASVTLRLPPPLDRPLTRAEGDDGTVRLFDGDQLIAEGAPADLDLDVPAPITLEQAHAAEQHSPWADRHPFPDCFGCGPNRSQEEAVAITVGAVEGATVRGHQLYAGTWTPLAEFADAGAVTPLFVWAALDCPTSWPALPPGANVAVLGRLTCRLIAAIKPEVTHTVIAWHVGSEGRKHRGAAAIHTPSGELCAYSEGLWIELRDPATMGAKV